MTIKIEKNSIRDLAPEANYIAMDADGQAYAYIQYPIRIGIYWLSPDGNLGKYIPSFNNYATNWKTSVVKI